MAKKQKKTADNTIAQNKRARHEIHISETYEAGMALMGWEVKSLREGKGQITESYVFFRTGEPFISGVQIQPLPTASTHFVTEPTRVRKLLLHSNEISNLQQAVDQKGHTVVALALYWKGHLVKCKIAIAKGKQLHDKRETEKERDWNRQKQRILQHNQ
jgi:SsrA-binding protein